MNNPKITVLMPAYNAAKYIGTAIQSVLEQTCSNFELLIVNDGSTDETRFVIRQFEDKRIRLIDQHNQGVAAALNRGLLEASGYYIARFDADDICMPHRLQTQVDFLDHNPDYIVTGCDVEFITDEGEYLCDSLCSGYSHEEIIQLLSDVCPFTHSGVMYRKKEVVEAGGYPLHAHTFEDHLLWVKLSGYGLFHNLHDKLIRVRVNPGSVTIDEKWRAARFRKLKKHILHKTVATKEEGDELLVLLAKQNTRKTKFGSYYALCGKKYLVNNYQPEKARKKIMQAIKHAPLRADNYLLYLASFFPERFIQWLASKV